MILATPSRPRQRRGPIGSAPPTFAVGGAAGAANCEAIARSVAQYNQGTPVTLPDEHNLVVEGNNKRMIIDIDRQITCTAIGLDW